MAERNGVLERDAVQDESAVYLVGAETARADDAPPGYQQTEIGVIPEDWAVKPVSDVATVKTGPFGSALHERDYVEDGTPIVTVEHLSDYGLVHENVPMVSDHDRRRLSSYELREGDIVFSRVGSVDRNSLVSTGEHGWLFSGRLLRVRVTNSNIDPKYLSYHFHSEAFKQRVRDVAVGQTMASLNTKILGGILAILPQSVEEQHAIATALSDADALIESLDRLLAKKRAIKQAAMQQLLTGQTRLPGFTGEWETRRLADIAEIDPENLGANTPGNYTFSYISLEQVEEGTLLGWSTERFRTAPSRARRVLREGDILVSTVRPNLKSHLKFGGQFPNAVCSTGFAVVRCAKDLVNPGYIYAHFFGSLINRQIEKIIAGSNYPAISSSDVRRLELPLPGLEEQVAIATVLSDMNAEIEALEHRRDKARQIKQGMMQQLLTGRVRLVKPKSTEPAPC